MDKLKYTYAFFFLLAAVSVFAALTAEQVIERVQNSVQTEKPLRVKFQQVFEWQVTGKVEKLDGEMLLDGLNKFRIVTPDQTVVSNGETMWTYSRLEDQVIIDNVTNDPQTLMPRDILFTYPETYNATLWKPGTELDGEPAAALRMTPKDKNQMMQELKVWVSKETWHPLQVEFTDMNKNTTSYQINSVTVDTTISAEAFTFEPNENTEVIDVR
ncbi:MAG: outer membrane lipoprotein carrier protein LolA [Candidatus Marinimicrobia bacterium]|nr:outer membrane lipoprotein carrier protein LolA [Candidatus Neomarinimicrobiota bacterium]MCF7827452.1 outer membrane lipoprotein carrier protein LolA [Candidatus Neomarinimicrobiota bacterium]MCF7882327.1 outer membrane lipoprotein carrier protein LolA [Candidatus Neomarinimicrobiota bacterium]